MSHARWTLVLVSIPALSPAALATVSDRFTLKIGSLQSQAQFDIVSSLGPCLIGSGARDVLSGELDVVLHPGLPPSSTAQLDGGRCAASRDLVGIVPSLVPGNAPLLVVHLGSFAFTPRSRVFACDPDGTFQAQTLCEVSEGQLDVSVLGGEFVSVPIVGLRSESAHSRGRVWIDETGIHLLCELENRLHVRVPQSDLSLRIVVRSMLRGDTEFPVPTQLHPATARPIHQALGIDRESGSRVSLREPVSFAAEELASAARPELLDELRLWTLVDEESRGLAAAVPCLDALESPDPLRLEPALASSRWCFQFAYREGLAAPALRDVLDRRAC